MHLSSFLKKAASLSGNCSTWISVSEFLSPYWENLFHFRNFLRHFVAILLELGPFRRLSQTSSFFFLINFFFIYNRCSSSRKNDWQLSRYFALWWVFLFMVGFSFFGSFHKTEKFFSRACYNFLATFSIAMLQLIGFNLYIYFRVSAQLPFIQLHSFNQNNKVTCDKCGTPITRINFFPHKKRCSVGLLCCSKYPNFSTKSQNDLYYLFAKKHKAQKVAVTFKCTLCYQEFRGFYALRQQRNTQYGFPIKTAIVDSDDIINEVDYANLKQELHLCLNFFVYYKLEWARNKAYLCYREPKCKNCGQKAWSFTQHFIMCSENESGF